MPARNVNRGGSSQWESLTYPYTTRRQDCNKKRGQTDFLMASTQRRGEKYFKQLRRWLEGARNASQEFSLLGNLWRAIGDSKFFTRNEKISPYKKEHKRELMGSGYLNPSPSTRVDRKYWGVWGQSKHEAKKKSCFKSLFETTLGEIMFRFWWSAATNWIFFFFAPLVFEAIPIALGDITGDHTQSAFWRWQGRLDIPFIIELRRRCWDTLLPHRRASLHLFHSPAYDLGIQ